MKDLTLALVAVIAATLFPAIRTTSSLKENATQLSAIRAKKLLAIACIPDRSDASLFSDDPLSMIPLPGWGEYRWPVQHKGDSSNFYFNQGINLYYSFHIFESLASFQKAAALSPEDPMPFWGIALACGPNINDVVYNYAPQAYAAARTADSLASHANPFEKQLIHAMSLRYSADQNSSRKTLDEAYAAAMKKVYTNFRNYPDAGTLYADALMLLHPWDLYTARQEPKPWTPEIIRVLEELLQISPKHPGVNHYYIHATEASKNPERALPSADRLGSLLPLVSHMVHMPSHIYIRTGMYEKGIQVNKDAIAGYQQYKALFPSAENGAFLYLMHNRHMQATSAMNAGKFTEAMMASEQLTQDIPVDYLLGAPPEAEYLQYMYMSKLFTHIRFGKWDEILAQPALADSMYYARILDAFGRSIAYSRKHRFEEAESEIRKIENLMQSTERLKVRMGAFNTAYAGGEVALALSKGILSEEKGLYAEAIQSLELAVTLEDAMVYDEPKDWLLPPRQYLGAAVLKSGNFSRAEQIFREDLAFNPQNGWSLKGLEMSVKAQQKTVQWKEVGHALEKLGKERQFNPLGPVF